MSAAFVEACDNAWPWLFWRLSSHAELEKQGVAQRPTWQLKLGLRCNACYVWLNCFRLQSSRPHALRYHGSRLISSGAKDLGRRTSSSRPGQLTAPIIAIPCIIGDSTSGIGIAGIASGKLLTAGSRKHPHAVSPARSFADGPPFGKGGPPGPCWRLEDLLLRCGFP